MIPYETPEQQAAATERQESARAKAKNKIEQRRRFFGPDLTRMRRESDRLLGGRRP